ncbi:hypothetical protein [Bradyrhizobium australafricanum]|uniref:hypothetical protein n=1 Tax=Bradyrhizobium australafricanum TaxID=2821406 RepID=UPI001CE2DA37|nr:hypothetical protein [Bradyrhizobium australafricanum]MCA6101212.1 hypothetical protein [Bradyrhizobium australafricanum]
MSAPQYEIVEADDGTFAVEVFDGVVADAAVTNFKSRKEAAEWISNERQRLGIEPRWQEAADD